MTRLRTHSVFSFEKTSNTFYNRIAEGSSNACLQQSNQDSELHVQLRCKFIILVFATLLQFFCSCTSKRYREFAILESEV
jgi:hypothetical protein